MDHESLDNDDWKMLVDRLGGSDAIALLARQTGAFIRPRNVKDADSLLRLCLGYGPGGQSLRSAAAWAEATGLASLSNVGLLKRLRKCSDWLDKLVATALKAGLPDDLPPRPIRIIDGSIVQKGPGQKGAWRFHCVYDLHKTGFSFFNLTDEKTGEYFDMAPVVPGEIRIGDRAYMQTDRIGKVLAYGGDILVRSGWNSARWLDEDGRKLDLVGKLKEAGQAGMSVLDIPVQVGRNSHKPPLALRLVAVAMPEQYAKKARRKARKTAKRKGHKISKETLQAAGWLILVTSLKREEFTLDMLKRLYRLRWQIELGFKRLKSLIGTKKPPGRDENLAKVFILSHLLIAVVIEPPIAKLRDSFPWA